MSRPFEALCETLLRAGIAPCHVRRYERELTEHLSDLVAMQNERGYDGEDALIRARALLGPDEELAEAMTARRQFRSLAARAPWLVFGIAPPFLVLALLISVGMSMVAAWKLFFADQYMIAPVPDWLQHLSIIWGNLAICGAGPLAAVFLAIVALNQRTPWRWPAFGVVFIALLSAGITFVLHFPRKGHTGEIGFGLTSEVPLWSAASRIGLTVLAVAAAFAIVKSQARRLSL